MRGAGCVLPGACCRVRGAGCRVVCVHSHDFVRCVYVRVRGPACVRARAQSPRGVPPALGDKNDSALSGLTLLRKQQGVACQFKVCVGGCRCVVGGCLVCVVCGVVGGG